MIVAVTLILACVYALCGCKLSMSEYKAESSEISASADTTASVDTSVSTEQMGISEVYYPSDSDKTSQSETGGNSNQTPKKDWSEHFDLTDEKVSIDYIVDNTTVRDFVWAELKKPIDDYVVTIEDFECEHIRALYYTYYNEPFPGRPEGDTDNFRPMVEIAFNTRDPLFNTNEEYAERIHKLERLDFVRTIYIVKTANA